MESSFSGIFYTVNVYVCVSLVNNCVCSYIYRSE